MKHLLLTTIAVTSLLATTTFADPIHDAARKGDIEAVEERLNFLTTLFLVIAEKYSYFYPHDGFVDRAKGRGEQINRTWMHTFPIFKKRLGRPTGSAIKNGYVYSREFKHCSVCLDIENEKEKLTWK
jgi:hypothetical protein